MYGPGAALRFYAFPTQGIIVPWCGLPILGADHLMSGGGAMVSHPVTNLFFSISSATNFFSEILQDNL